MKRLIHIFVAICLLGSQSVWAFYDIELDNHQEENYVYIADLQSDSPDDCDHFCHASAHLSGIFTNESFEFPKLVSINNGQLEQLTYSINYRPPTPPPLS